MNDDVIMPWLLVPLDDMGRVVSWISARRNRQVQAALAHTLVHLRFHVRSRGLASDRARDYPRTSCPFTDRIARITHIARGPAAAAKVRRAGPPRGKQRAIVSMLDSRTQA